MNSTDQILKKITDFTFVWARKVLCWNFHRVMTEVVYILGSWAVGASRHCVDSFSLDKMTPISQMIFSDVFSWMKIVYFDSNFTEGCY